MPDTETAVKQVRQDRRRPLPAPRPYRKVLSLVLAAALAATPPCGLLAAPDDLPDLGDSSEASLSHMSERKLGIQAMQSLRAQGGYLDDPEVNDYLQNLGQRLVAADPGIGEHFEFFAVGSSAINAFALPGGHVGVNSGLVRATQSESELASVLAHEISHVSQHHIARQFAAQANALAALLLALVVGARGNADVGSAVIAGVQAAQMQSQITFTRENEQEADRIGFTLLDRAGFDTGAMASFFERLQQATRVVDGSTPAWLRDHLEASRTRYEAALSRFPEHLQLVHDYPRVLLMLRQYADAASFTEERLHRRPDDETLHQLAAEAEAGLGQDLKSRYHQGEYYATQGDIKGAVQQLELAVKSRGGDFQDIQVAEARLRELREQQRELKKQGRSPAGFKSGNTALRGFTRD